MDCNENYKRVNFDYYTWNVVMDGEIHWTRLVLPPLLMAKITIIPSTFTVDQKYNSIIGGFEFLANGPISVLL